MPLLHMDSPLIVRKTSSRFQPVNEVKRHKWEQFIGKSNKEKVAKSALSHLAKKKVGKLELAYLAKKRVGKLGLAHLAQNER